MRATAQLKVQSDMRVTVTLDLDVSEMSALLAATKDLNSWPSISFRSVLQQALSKADGVYQSNHEIDA